MLSDKIFYHTLERYGNIFMLVCPVEGRLSVNLSHYFIKGISTLPWNLQECGSPSVTHSGLLLELRI